MLLIYVKMKKKMWNARRRREDPCNGKKQRVDFFPFKLWIKFSQSKKTIVDLDKNQNKTKKSHKTGQSSNYAAKSIVIKIVKIEKKMTLVFSTMLKLWGCLLTVTVN